MQRPIIKLGNISHIYPDKTQVDIDGIEFYVNPGDRVVVLGANGVGKTTLLHHILGLLAPSKGRVEVLGLDPYRNFKEVRKKIGVVFQDVDEQIIGPRVYDDIAFTPLNDGIDRETVDQLVRQIAHKLDIEDLLNKIPHYLSGGEKKKVALAGALVSSPKILVMDEPLNGLDPKSKNELVDYINSINDQTGMTTIITTHDVNIVPKMADIVYILLNGSIVLRGKPEDVLLNIEVLEQANLEPPILMELFRNLSERGYNLGIPASIEEAVLIILNTLNK